MRQSPPCWWSRSRAALASRRSRRRRRQRQQDRSPDRPAADVAARKAWLRTESFWGRRDAGAADLHREALVRWYGPERGKRVKYAEAFEVCEYGRRGDEALIRRLFPFFD